MKITGLFVAAAFLQSAALERELARALALPDLSDLDGEWLDAPPARPGKSATAAGRRAFAE